MLTHAIRCHNFEHESESCENNNQSHRERERAQIKIEKKNHTRARYMETGIDAKCVCDLLTMQ